MAAYREMISGMRQTSLLICTIQMLLLLMELYLMVQVVLLQLLHSTWLMAPYGLLCRRVRICWVHRCCWFHSFCALVLFIWFGSFGASLLWIEDRYQRIGCILLAVGQGEFHGEALHTLNYVVNQSDYTVDTLRNVTEYMELAKTVNVAQVFLPSDVRNDIDHLNTELNAAADTLKEKTNENSRKIERVFNTVRSALIAVAAVMLLISLFGLVLSIFGYQHAIHVFVISGWLLVAVTFILCGVFVILNNAIAGTCMAMREWVDNPHAETALSNILRYVDQATTNQTLWKSKQVVDDIINIVNEFVNSYANLNLHHQAKMNSYNQSGPLVPHLCYPYDAQLQNHNCSDQEVSMANASVVWQNYTCNASPDGRCSSLGRLTPDMYAPMVDTRDKHQNHLDFHLLYCYRSLLLF